MGFKKINGPYELFPAGSNSMSATNTITGSSNVQNLDNLGMTISWTGSPTGTLKVQASTDGTTYKDLSFTKTPLPQPAGSADSFPLNLHNFPWAWVRVTYTNVSGSGTLSAVLFAKDLN
jgi:hypothetical protein